MHQQYYDTRTGQLLHPSQVILQYTQEKEERIMAGLDAVTAAVKAAEARLDGVVTTVNGLKSTVAQLQAQIAAQPNVDPELQALADELDQHVASFDSALNPPSTDTSTTGAPQQ